MWTASLDGPSIAAGAYVGLGCSLVGTIAGVGGTSLLAGCGLVWLIVALAIGSRPELWVALGRRRLLAAPMIVATGPLVAIVFWSELGAFDASLPLLIGLCGLAILGLALRVLGTGVYADRVAGELRAYWTADPDPGRRRRVRRWSLLLGLGTVAAFVGTLYGAPSFLVSGTLAALISMQIDANRPREYEACEHGLKYADIGSVGTQYLPWERVDGLRETDEAVVLERRWWIDERIAADEVPPDAREAIRAAVGSPTTR